MATLFLETDFKSDGKNKFIQLCGAEIKQGFESIRSVTRLNRSGVNYLMSLSKTFAEKLKAIEDSGDDDETLTQKMVMAADAPIYRAIALCSELGRVSSEWLYAYETDRLLPRPCARDIVGHDLYEQIIRQDSSYPREISSALTYLQRVYEKVVARDDRIRGDAADATVTRLPAPNAVRTLRGPAGP